MEPKEVFWSAHYLRHNQRRQEHLASLGLPLRAQRVLETGAGIGDHTSFFLDRGCSVVVTEAQDQNLAILSERYADGDIRRLDLDLLPPDPIAVDVVYSYGTLYHLERPAEALAWMARCAGSLLLLETCVAAGDGEELHAFREQPAAPENAIRGEGCRPTRGWVWRELAASFPYVYMPVTQPWHEEFPLDWSRSYTSPLIRSVFIGSRQQLVNPLLADRIPLVQVHEPADAAGVRF